MNHTYSNQLISFTEAAKLLGYRSSKIIENLVNQNHLQVHFKLGSSRRLVDAAEVKSLIKPVDKKSI